MKKRIGVLLITVLLLCLVGCGDSAAPAAAEPPVTGAAVNAEGNTTGEAADLIGEIDAQPLPEDKPAPVESQDVKVDEKTVYHCTISIECGTILDNMADLTAGKEEIVPEDGVILADTEVEFYQGESAFDVLLRVTKDQKIHMEFVSTPIYNSNYIEGIGNLYEFDCGSLSGWMYKVNDWFPNYGCSRYELADGDVIEWIYTCDLGRDIGAEFYEQQ